MNTWARPGAECICLNSRWSRHPRLRWVDYLRALFAGLPVAGCRYVVDRVGLNPDDQIAITLRGFGSIAFRVDNFRPVVKSSEQQDVALFAPLLDPSHPRIPDDAPAPEKVSS